MKKTIRTIGILLIIISIIFALVNIGLLRFNYFTLLSNGTAEIFNDSFDINEVTKINVNMADDIVEYAESSDNKVHFAYINSDKFYYDIVKTDGIVNVNLTDNLMWYDTFSLYRKIPIQIAIPKGLNVEVYVNGKLKENIDFVKQLRDIEI